MDEESSAAIIAHKLLKRFSEACIYGNQGGYSFMAKEVLQIIRDAKESSMDAEPELDPVSPCYEMQQELQETRTMLHEALQRNELLAMEIALQKQRTNLVIAAEREACAKIVDGMAQDFADQCDSYSGYTEFFTDYAKTIRKRGE